VKQTSLRYCDEAARNSPDERGDSGFTCTEDPFSSGLHHGSFLILAGLANHADYGIDNRDRVVGLDRTVVQGAKMRGGDGRATDADILHFWSSHVHDANVGRGTGAHCVKGACYRHDGSREKGTRAQGFRGGDCP
jgi:hypothetical protein